MTYSCADITRKYNSIINSYIKEGYFIGTPQLTAQCYGYANNEIAHIDLQHPKHKDTMIRIWMLEGSENISDVPGSTQYVYILVNKHIKENDCWYVRTYNGTTLDTYKFYKIGKKKSDAYVRGIDELKRCIEIRKLRAQNKEAHSRNTDLVHWFDVNKLSDKFISSIMTKIKAVRGFARADKACIKEVRLIRGNQNPSIKAAAYVEFEFNGKSGKLKI